MVWGPRCTHPFSESNLRGWFWKTQGIKKQKINVKGKKRTPIRKKRKKIRALSHCLVHYRSSVVILSLFRSIYSAKSVKIANRVRFCFITSFPFFFGLNPRTSVLGHSVASSEGAQTSEVSIRVTSPLNWSPSPWPWSLHFWSCRVSCAYTSI